MRRLIRGDIRRILSKLGFYIIPALFYLLMYIDPSESANKKYDFDLSYTGISMVYKSAFAFVVAIPVFIGVYADELKAGAMQTCIGRGLSRVKILLSKFIDTVILTVFFYIFSYCLEMLIMRFHLVFPTPQQNLSVIVVFGASCMKCIGALAFAAIFLYITWNPSVGVVVLIISLGCAEPLLQFIQTNTKLPVLDYSYMGVVDQAFANIAAGSNFLLPGLLALAYVVIFIWISIRVFNRKELEL